MLDLEQRFVQITDQHRVNPDRVTRVYTRPSEGRGEDQLLIVQFQGDEGSIRVTASQLTPKGCALLLGDRHGNQPMETK